MAKKTAAKTKETSLKYQPVNAWDKLTPVQDKEMEQVAKRYIDFLGTCKTERETLTYLEQHAKKHGFREFAPGRKLKAGDRLYWISKNRAMGMAIVGRRPIADGVRMLAAHHDVPHLDLKALPLYERHGLGLLRTHYYGGVKKFQWATIPLAIHGFACTKKGKTLSFAIGEKADDPVFTILDIAPHLSYKIQNDRKATEVLRGEELQVVAGHRPQPLKKGETKGEDRIKMMVLEYLQKHFGFEEEDLAWAEVAVVPAMPPREVGMDRSLIGGFGHDDRACVFASFEALLGIKTPEHTAAALFFDKEEIGSAGASGAQSMMVTDFFACLVEAATGSCDFSLLRRTMCNSQALSADTNAAIDPIFEGAYDSSNAGLVGRGVWVCKFTGSGGKAGSSEADVEFVAQIRDLLTDAKIPYQFGEMGKVDEGGGGTVAKFLAQLNMHVLDIAIPVLSLHSPFEVLSKVDLYYSVLAYRVFMAK
ncbi:MAG TPA: aminopeptidase [Candidatus Ozemobacteraceae bacterium]|nr:aminopeptidase [Candidatus Ozemobacteraceae bacterium]